jgi:hypothetical protein
MPRAAVQAQQSKEAAMPFREENDDIETLSAASDHRDHGGRVPALPGSGIPEMT